MYLKTINSFKFIKRTPSFQTLMDKYFKPQPISQDMNEIGQGMAETIEKILPVANQLGISLEESVAIVEKTSQLERPNPFEIKFLLPNSGMWESTNRYFDDEVEAIKAALLYSENKPEYMVGIRNRIFITKIRNGEPINIYPGHEMNVIAALELRTQMPDDAFGTPSTKEPDPNYEQQDVFEEDSQNQMIDDPAQYLIFSKLGFSKWKSVHFSQYRKLKDAIIGAEKYASCTKDCMTAVRHIDGQDVIKFRAGGGEPCFINPDFEDKVNAVFQNQPVDVVMDITVSCPDCKDGFYYPFVGPKEPCRTCHG